MRILGPLMSGGGINMGINIFLSHRVTQTYDYFYRHMHDH